MRSVGPVLDLRDAIATKVIAMVRRGLPRDFIDVAAVAGDHPRRELVDLACVCDPGLPDGASAPDTPATDICAAGTRCGRGGRRPGAGSTRRVVLDAARARFAGDGFAATAAEVTGADLESATRNRTPGEDLR